MTEQLHDFPVESAVEQTRSDVSEAMNPRRADRVRWRSRAPAHRPGPTPQPTHTSKLRAAEKAYATALTDLIRTAALAA